MNINHEVRLEPEGKITKWRCPACLEEQDKMVYTDGDTLEAGDQEVWRRAYSSILVGACPGCGSLAFDVEIVCACEASEKEDCFIADHRWTPARQDVYRASWKHWRWELDHQCEVAFDKHHSSFPGRVLPWVDCHFLGPFHDMDGFVDEGTEAGVGDCSAFAWEHARHVAETLLPANIVDHMGGKTGAVGKEMRCLAAGLE